MGSLVWHLCLDWNVWWQSHCSKHNSLWRSVWSSQLYTQLKQLRNWSLKKIQAWTGFEPMTSAIPVQCLSWVYNCDDQTDLHFILRSSNIWTFIYSLVFFNFYGYITNSQNGQLPVGLIAQMVEHCTGIAEVTGSNPVQAWDLSDWLFWATGRKRGLRS